MVLLCTFIVFTPPHIRLTVLIGPSISYWAERFLSADQMKRELRDSQSASQTSNLQGNIIKCSMIDNYTFKMCEYPSPSQFYFIVIICLKVTHYYQLNYYCPWQHVQMYHDNCFCLFTKISLLYAVKWFTFFKQELANW